MRRNIVPIVLAASCLSVCMTASAQSANAGDIRGTAKDPSGALLPDVTVTITNTQTGVAKTLTTNKDGLYDSGPIVTGNYSVSFTKDGFTTFNRTGLNLDVATVTVDGELKVGGTNEQVTVNTDVALIETETGEQSATLNFNTLNQLPNTGGSGTGPTWENFTVLIPGAAGTPSGAQGVSNPGQSVSVNGNLPQLHPVRWCRVDPAKLCKCRHVCLRSRAGSQGQHFGVLRAVRGWRHPLQPDQ